MILFNPLTNAEYWRFPLWTRTLRQREVPTGLPCCSTWLQRWLWWLVFPVAWFMAARHGTFLAALCEDTWSASVLGTHGAGPHSDKIPWAKIVWDVLFCSRRVLLVVLEPPPWTHTKGVCSHTPLTPGPRTLAPSSGLSRCPHMHTHTHTQTYIEFFKK